MRRDDAAYLLDMLLSACGQDIFCLIEPLVPPETA